jgi:hypothetical protein
VTNNGTNFAFCILFNSTTTSSSYTVTNFKFFQIGAVAEYDGSGIASDKWFDKSGNDYHGSVVGATVENAPSGEEDGLIYEVGTWTPILCDLNNNAATLSTALGTYTRIGRFVMVGYQITVSSKGSMTGGYVLLKNIPFDHASGAYNGTGMIDYWRDMDTNYSCLMWDTSSTVDRFWLTGVVAAGAASVQYVPTADIGGNETLKGAVIYQIF